MGEKSECQKCVEKNGGVWSAASVSDLQEGLCPAVHDDEVYHCKLTGQKLVPRGRIHLIVSV